MERNKHDITVDQWLLLSTLHNHPKISQKELASLTGKDPASVTRTLHILEKDALIFRSVTPEDQRRHILGLTETGKSLLHKLWPLTIDIKAVGTKGLNDNEMNQLHHILQQIIKNFDSN